MFHGRISLAIAHRLSTIRSLNQSSKLMQLYRSGSLNPFFSIPGLKAWPTFPPNFSPGRASSSRSDRTAHPPATVGARAAVAEGDERETASAAEFGLGEAAVFEGVKDLEPLAGSAGAAHAAPSRGSDPAVDGPDRALERHRDRNLPPFASLAPDTDLRQRPHSRGPFCGSADTSSHSSCLILAAVPRTPFALEPLKNIRFRLSTGLRTASSARKKWKAEKRTSHRIWLRVRPPRGSGAIS